MEGTRITLRGSVDSRRPRRTLPSSLTKLALMQSSTACIIRDHERSCCPFTNQSSAHLSIHLLLSVLCAFGSGCNAAIQLTPLESPEVGFGGTETLVRDYPYPCDVVWKAAQLIMSHLGMNVLNSTPEARGGSLTARRSDGHVLDLEVSEIDPAHSQVTVRVVQGDGDLSWLVQQEILIWLRAG